MDSILAERMFELMSNAATKPYIGLFLSGEKTEIGPLCDLLIQISLEHSQTELGEYGVLNFIEY